MCALAICVGCFVLHYVVWELNIFCLVSYCAKMIETYFWTSLFCVFLIAQLTLDRLETQKRHRHSVYSELGSPSYSSGGRPSALNVCSGQSCTSQLKQRNMSLVARTVNKLTEFGESLGLVQSLESRSINATLQMRRNQNLELLKARARQD